MTLTCPRRKSSFFHLDHYCSAVANRSRQQRLLQIEPGKIQWWHCSDSQIWVALHSPDWSSSSVSHFNTSQCKETRLDIGSTPWHPWHPPWWSHVRSHIDLVDVWRNPKKSHFPFPHFRVFRSPSRGAPLPFAKSQPWDERSSNLDIQTI